MQKISFVRTPGVLRPGGDFQIASKDRGKGKAEDGRSRSRERDTSQKESRASPTDVLRAPKLRFAGKDIREAIPPRVA